MDNPRLVTDEEFFEWCGNHTVEGCGGTRMMGDCDREVSICEDCRAKAQDEKTYQIGKQEGFEMGLEQGKREGKRKLVEWLNKGSMDAHTIIFQVSEKEWEALEKEVE